MWSTSLPYPQADDLNKYLTQLGLTLTNFKGTGSDFSTVLNLAQAVESGSNMLERECKRVFLVDNSVTQERPYDPPVNKDNAIDLGFDIYSITQINYTPYQSDPLLLVVNEDYWLEPIDYSQRGVPIKRVKMWRMWSGPISRALRGSIKITGKWAYAATLPAEVKVAMLARSVQQLMPNVRHAFARGLISWEEAGVREFRGQDPLGYMNESLENQVIKPVFKQFRKWWV